MKKQLNQSNNKKKYLKERKELIQQYLKLGFENLTEQQVTQFENEKKTLMQKYGIKNGT